MSLIYALVRSLHILAGLAGLALAIVPLVTRKGARLHRQTGRWFVRAMATAGITGLAMSVSWLVAPAYFHPAGVTDPVAARMSGLFLGTIGLVTLAALQQMVGALTRKRSPAPAPSVLDLALPIAMAAAGLISITAGVLAQRGLLLAFGALAVANGISDLRFVLRPLPTRMAWWYQHMRGAMGAIIAAVTAFLVFGASRLIDGLLPPALAWLPWVAPTAVAVPLFTLWIARFRQRFGEVA
jgi:hypothetical protein